MHQIREKLVFNRFLSIFKIAIVNLLIKLELSCKEFPKVSNKVFVNVDTFITKSTSVDFVVLKHHSFLKHQRRLDKDVLLRARFAVSSQ
jgi:hypothetical protein